MSYWLEDADKVWLGDFATNLGIVQLRDGAPESLLRFLDEGEADEELIVDLTADLGDNHYITEILRGAKPPVVITDGTGYAGDE